MNNNLKKEKKKFYKEIKHQLKLSYNSKQSREIFTVIQKSTESYFEEHPTASFADFQKDYGTAKDIIESALEFMDIELISEKMNSSFLVKRCCIVILMLSILAFAIKTGLYIKSYLDVQEDRISYSETVIE